MLNYLRNLWRALLGRPPAQTQDGPGPVPSEVSPISLMAELLIVYAGWQLFPDGPLAFYCIMGVWVTSLMFRLGLVMRGEWWAPCLFGAFLGTTQAVCGLAYVGDGRSFLCDKGTGLPITSVVMALAFGVLYYLIRKRYGRSTD